MQEPDVEALVDYIYTTLDLDLSTSSTLRRSCWEIDGHDDQFELMHRTMFVDLTRLLSAIETERTNRHIVTLLTGVCSPTVA
jgi:3-oxoacyl-ACP reductase-like protein